MKFPYDNIALASFNKNFDLKVPLMRKQESIIDLYRSVRETNKGVFSGIKRCTYKFHENF